MFQGALGTVEGLLSLWQRCSYVLCENCDGPLLTLGIPFVERPWWPLLSPCRMAREGVATVLQAWSARDTSSEAAGPRREQARSQSVCSYTEVLFLFPYINSVSLVRD